MDQTVKAEIRFNKPLKNDSLWAFYRSVSAIISSGRPIQEAFEMAAKESADPSVQATASGILDELMLRGSSLPKAIAYYPNMFSDTNKALIAAGDKVGRLDVIFRKIADDEEAKDLTRRRIAHAFVMPGVTLLATLLLIVMAPSLFVDSIRNFMAELQLELPPLSRVVFAISDLFHPKIFLPILAVVIIVGVAMRHQWPMIFRHTLLRGRLIRLAYRFPALASTIKSITQAHWARVVSLQLDSGVVTTEAIVTLKQSLNDPVFSQACQMTVDRMREDGINLSEAMASTGYFDRLVVGVIATGEESGHITEMLDFIADLYEEEFRLRLEMLEQVLAPIMLCFCGLLAGVWTIAILLPMAKMTGSLA